MIATSKQLEKKCSFFFIYLKLEGRGEGLLLLFIYFVNHLQLCAILASPPFFKKKVFPVYILIVSGSEASVLHWETEQNFNEEMIRLLSWNNSRLANFLSPLWKRILSGSFRPMHFWKHPIFGGGERLMLQESDVNTGFYYLTLVSIGINVLIRWQKRRSGKPQGKLHRIHKNHRNIYLGEKTI